MTNTYSNSELTDMVLTYGEARGNAAKARRIYLERYPGRNAPAPRTFYFTVQRLRDTGSFQRQKYEGGRLPVAMNSSSSSGDEEVDEEGQKVRKEHRTYLEIPNIRNFYEVLKK